MLSCTYRTIDIHINICESKSRNYLMQQQAVVNSEAWFTELLLLLCLSQPFMQRHELTFKVADPHISIFQNGKMAVNLPIQVEQTLSDSRNSSQWSICITCLS